MSEQYSGEMIVGLMNTVGKVLMPLVIPTQSQGRDVDTTPPSPSLWRRLMSRLGRS